MELRLSNNLRDNVRLHPWVCPCVTDADSREAAREEREATDTVISDTEEVFVSKFDTLKKKQNPL